MAQIDSQISLAAALLKQGSVIGIPTETVYGLAANAFDKEAILKIFAIKNRPSFDPLIAHIDSADKLNLLTDNINELDRTLMDHFWPGPLTILFQKSSTVPDILTSGLDAVAIRMPSHPITRALLTELDFPLAAPSANPFGYISPTTAQHVNDQLGGKIDFILDGGDSDLGLESTVVSTSAAGITVHRLGSVAIEELEKIARVSLDINNSSNPKAPGMIKSHYAPKKEIMIGSKKDILETCNEGDGVIAFSDWSNNHRHLKILSPSKNLSEAAHNLFKFLREMDNLDIDRILAEKVPQQGLGRAINDRLERASTKR